MNAATIRLLDLFSYSHLPSTLQPISKAVGELAMQMATELESDDLRVVDELLVGLRRLLEAKDCFVRAKLHMPVKAGRGPCGQETSGIRESQCEDSEEGRYL